MSEDEAAQVDEDPDTKAEALAANSTAEAEEQPAAEAGSEESGIAGAVDDRASQLTGAQGASQTDAPVANNRGPVAQAEEHLGGTNISDDRETLKKLQEDM